MKPILFTGAMVRALLAGTKTQTRRIVRGAFHEPGGYLQSEPVGDGGEWCFGCSKVPASFLTRCPCGAPGDKLWVRETWRTINDPATCIGDALAIDYRADGIQRIGDKIGTLKWKPSIFMPRWASRITLQVTGVRVERLQEITAQDAISEGISVDDSQLRETPNFRELWDSINAGRGYGWASNPWVWRIEFTRLTSLPHSPLTK